MSKVVSIVLKLVSKEKDDIIPVLYKQKIIGYKIILGGNNEGENRAGLR